MLRGGGGELRRVDKWKRDTGKKGEARKGVMKLVTTVDSWSSSWGRDETPVDPGHMVEMYPC